MEHLEERDLLWHDDVYLHAIAYVDCFREHDELGHSVKLESGKFLEVGFDLVGGYSLVIHHPTDQIRATFECALEDLAKFIFKQFFVIRVPRLCEGCVNLYLFLFND